MKILLLTLHSQNNNFGSVLQAYSLYKKMEEMGHNVTVLNYQPYYSNGATNFKNRIKKAIINTMFLPQYVKRCKKFNKILNLENKTAKFTKLSELKENAQNYDLFVIGSDQVWNPNYLCGKDPAYKLSFTTGNNKISYAASIGTKNVTDTQLAKLIEDTKDFRFISLRENFSALMLQGAGRKDAKFVLDPVFLYDKEHYKKLANTPKYSGYILVYAIHKDPFIASVVDVVAKKLNKKVVQVGGFASKCSYDYFDRSAGPQDFLGLIDNADFVITSSFHGLAFSHVLQKQFMVVMPSDNTLRLENILECFKTTDRVVKNIEDIDGVLSKTIDYDAVSQKINALRNSSVEFLQNALTVCSEK